MNSSRTTQGTGFFGLLTIVFIVLKLTKVIEWSWIWILSPLWISLVISIVVGISIVAVKYRKSIPCIFKGHNYESKYEVTRFMNGENHKYVTRCSRCGKVRS